MNVYKPLNLNITIRYEKYYFSYLPGFGVVDPPGVDVAGFGVVDVSSFSMLNIKIKIKYKFQTIKLILLMLNNALNVKYYLSCKCWCMRNTFLQWNTY